MQVILDVNLVNIEFLFPSFSWSTYLVLQQIFYLLQRLFHEWDCNCVCIYFVFGIVNWNWISSATEFGVNMANNLEWVGFFSQPENDNIMWDFRASSSIKKKIQYLIINLQLFPNQNGAPCLAIFIPQNYVKIIFFI